jgi:carboxyl-terminal processing protease
LRILAVAAALPALLAAGETLSVSRRQLNLDSFDTLWTTVRDRHWDPQLGGLDWNAARAEFRPRVEKAGTMEQARAAMTAMLALLKQSHFGIIPAEVYGDLENAGAARDGETGLDVRVLDGQAVVTRVEPGSAAEAAGVGPGWVVLEIDGKPPGPALAGIEKNFRNSTLRDARLAGLVKSRLAGKTGERAQLTLLAGGGHRKLDLVRRPPRGSLTRVGHMPPMHVWIEARRIPHSIGYIGFNLFMDPAGLMGIFNREMKACLDCEGMILDLRGNPGGIAGLAMGMAGWFLDEQRYLGTMHTREAPLKFVISPRPETYGGPLAILVDGCSGSTAEIFAGGMQDLRRARIFGTRTAGAALPSSVEKLPNGDGFQFAHAHYVSAGGRPLEGVGVIPDVEIALRREALLQGRDQALEAAVQWIRARKGRR